MNLVSVQVGRPRKVRWHGKVISTGIYKVPVAGRVMLHRLNLDGDQQADLTVHGGADKAVYNGERTSLIYLIYCLECGAGIKDPSGI